ncbi:MAG TPA: SDR family oxidoreductase [Cytophagales bacterium]|nr:SDR family oxidoreductase [Cytophagales bacterium]
MSSNFRGKVVIITGGSSGIGKACAEVFGKEGCRIIITGRTKESLNEASSELNKMSIEHLAIQADSSLEEDNKMVIDRAIEKYGQIDIFIANAGISMRAMFNDLDLSVIKRVMDTNFYGAVYGIKYALPHILKTKGSIVGVSSVAGFRGVPARSGYSASKFALQGFLEVLRTELLKTGVHVLIACPGFTSSNIRVTSLTKDGSPQGQSPLEEKNLMTSEEVAIKILNAVKKRKIFSIMSPKDRLTVFLNKLFPSFMDKMVYNHMAKEEGAPFGK